MSQAAASLRRDAHELSGLFPPLLAEAQLLSANVQLGAHGRRRPGFGDEFWQYRPAQPFDDSRKIDWRRSARSDQHFIREQEWQASQSVHLWVDTSQSMGFGSKGVPTKSARARLLAMSLTLLLLRGEERVGLTGLQVPPRAGMSQAQKIATHLMTEAAQDFASPDVRGIVPKSRAVFFSDFLAPLAPLERAVTRAADQGVRGTLVQILDPQEETFPYVGRTLFESMGASVSFETQQAGGLQAAYLSRLQERKDQLKQLARLTGWHMGSMRTDQAAQLGLLWIYNSLEGHV